ncbi:hypothetical protein EHP00_1465 [Ecytonucleospora hepatopenaei]|uniref:Uncharacterized protein n=1 Tax=Ecytonucleospora hepatopenaei TaxID=646526 RepID=A0A1W0E780_9MICR|nr:hypothetical protein EHP00_1465 [Ecytonucleospora hepatopenaei]
MDTLMNIFSNNKIVKELQELSRKIFEEKEEFGPEGLSLLKRALETVSIEDMRIKNFSKSDSNIISTLIFKQNTLNFVKYAVETRETVTNDLLDSVIDVLYDIKDCSKNLAVILEKQRLEREIFYLVVDICYLTKYTNEKLQLSVREKTMPDELSVNFALLSTGPFKSYELSVLNELKINNVLVNFLTGYKNKLRKIVKETIIDEVCKKITTNNLESVYSIFFVLNERTKKEFFEIEEKQCDEYIAFMSSLIGDLDSAEYVYEKLSSSFDRMEEALKQFIFYSKEKTLKMSTRDEALIFYILNTVEKISAYKTSGFYKFLGVFQDVLPLNISIRNKAKIYEILVHFIMTRRVYKEECGL